MYAHLGESSNIVRLLVNVAVLAEVEAVSEETLISARLGNLWLWSEKQRYLLRPNKQGASGWGNCCSSIP